MTLLAVNGWGCDCERLERTSGSQRSRHLGGWRWAMVMKRDISAVRQLFGYTADMPPPRAKGIEDARPSSVDATA